ncbi:DUF4892 domain-containing protein [uncultured Neptuniibacter sp.]|uniref:DUF4892 domain-containing protein n=1 Tax=uncultured Neptuniibacter sp. TaxID=502143 RepID=UPI00262387B7|nr:DUF4892 domain-containing protein [uncultured Neptuniibacter sp.]
MRALWIVMIVLVAIRVHAASDISGAKDFPNLKRFPGSYIVQFKQEKGSDYRLILGGLQKIDGQLRPEKEQRLDGTLTRMTYRIPENHSAKESFRYLVEQLETQGADILFECFGRDCGSSNQWANNIFKYSRLYGVDSTQSYAVYKLGNQNIIIYAVRRGNKRVYLRLEVLEVEQIDLPTALGQGIAAEFKGQAEDFDQLVSFLAKNPDKVIWIVPQNGEPGTREEQLKRSAEQGRLIKQRLIEIGVTPELIRVYPLGGFVMNPQQAESVFIYSD